MENLSGLAANPQSSRTPAPLALRVGFWICIAIAVAVVLRRLVALAHPSTSGPPQLSGLDASFESHAMLTVAHIVPALVFVLLVPLYFSRRFAYTVWLERLLFFPGHDCGHHRLCHERRCCWRLAGTLGSSLLQHPVPLLARSRLSECS